MPVHAADDYLQKLIAGAIAGTALGFAIGIFVYPYWFLNDVASETVVNPETKTKIATGMFVHANPSDPIHYGKGGVSVYRRTLFLEADFEVGPGPKFHVYLVPKQSIRASADVHRTMFVDLGRLRAFKGSQKYPIPPGVDLKDYPSAVIWCAEFGVLISPADLTFGPA